MDAGTAIRFLVAVQGGRFPPKWTLPAVNVNLTAPAEPRCTLTAVDAVFVQLA